MWLSFFHASLAFRKISTFLYCIQNRPYLRETRRCRTVGNSYNYRQHSAGAKIHMGQVCLTIPLPVLFRCGSSPNFVEGINFMKGKTEFFRCFCVENWHRAFNLASRHRVSIRGRIFGSFWRKSSAKVAPQVPQVLSLSILRIFQTTFLKGFSWWRH